MRAIIIAAGDATRWANYLGVPKHFAPLCGEPIIERTIRQLHDNGLNSDDILVASKDYQLSGCKNIRPKLNPEHHDADKFLSSSWYWSQQERTLIIYGDVFFTDEAINKIVKYEPTGWTMFCRPTPSDITGTEWGECFAVSMYPWHLAEAQCKLFWLIGVYDAGVLGRIGGWEWARAMWGVPAKDIAEHRIELENYYVIDDLTDDLDYPDDYERLREAICKTLTS